MYSCRVSAENWWWVTGRKTGEWSAVGAEHVCVSWIQNPECFKEPHQINEICSLMISIILRTTSTRVDWTSSWNEPRTAVIGSRDRIGPVLVESVGLRLTSDVKNIYSCWLISCFRSNRRITFILQGFFCILQMISVGLSLKLQQFESRRVRTCFMTSLLHNWSDTKHRLDVD